MPEMCRKATSRALRFKVPHGLVCRGLPFHSLIRSQLGFEPGTCLSPHSGHWVTLLYGFLGVFSLLGTWLHFLVEYA